MAAMTPGTWVQWLLVAGVAGGLGFGATRLDRAMDPPRPDPFTGTQGRELMQRIEAVRQEGTVVGQENSRMLEKVGADMDRINERGTLALQSLAQRVSECERRSLGIEAAMQELAKQTAEIRVTVARIDERLQGAVRR